MRRAARRAGRGGPREGFTLVETLVALAVVAVVGVALQRGVVSARFALARAEALLEAEAVARDVLENRLDALAPGVGTLRGDDRGLVVTVTSEALDLALPPPGPPDPAEGPAQAPGREPGQRPAPGQGPVQIAAGAPRQAGEGPGGEAAADAELGRFTPLRVTIRVDPAIGPPLVVETLHAAPAP
ncbi:prepilin-type N-terminal cleavage/methylation domain-containing protein [Methylopila capsulata]|uniref:Prepilin-type N-terminal cleavage/methylation domain-containing protein n=1 Tax=Methylopila capsulata TaxID=61654 RepID=A0A9W6IRF1_9HYPH|nr:prepilin-type N-terminal cleavage/methylation domain-containing protein [Methylopila capsulata]MBM7850936.1 prepilin-type N-terminal cleavage/methylation domain-containing protein [Methylopila capsulata]GLK53994.1 hypothetical protein GCM10008170_00130 [Methylopila capsulata]